MENNYSRQLKGTIVLLIASLIWGLAFVAQKMGMDYLGPFTFNGLRMFLGSFVLLPFVFISKKLNSKNKDNSNAENKSVIKSGLMVGLCLFLASSLQQVGIIYTTAGKSGFITAMYIIIVPIIGLFLGKKPRGIIVFSILIAVIGMYLLCITDSFSVNIGDGITLLCAFVFAIHIIIIETVADWINPIELSCIQFAVCGVLSTIIALFRETTKLEFVLAALPAILFMGLFSCGVAYTLQIVGQKLVPATIASLSMSFESVFAVLGAAIILHDVMSKREIIGCILMFLAVIISQIPGKKSLESDRRLI